MDDLESGPNLAVHHHFANLGCGESVPQPNCEDDEMNTTALLRHGLLNEKWDKINEIVLIFSKWIYEEAEKWMWKR